MTQTIPHAWRRVKKFSAPVELAFEMSGGVSIAACRLFQLDVSIRHATALSLQTAEGHASRACRGNVACSLPQMRRICRGGSKPGAFGYSFHVESHLSKQDGCQRNACPRIDERGAKDDVEHTLTGTRAVRLAQPMPNRHAVSHPSAW